jgi:omega-hydroxy-beta-dihydromenaquinone-9 sulfotransferase
MMRIAFLVQSSLWSSIFAGIENARYHKKIAETKITQDPVFIVGHWRTGSTFLHQLMSKDPGLYAPTLFDVAQPECLLSAYTYFSPVFAALVDKHRPMDNVKLGMNEPQEDEYAMYRLTGFSPLERLIFPKSEKYFLDETPDWLPLGKEHIIWEEKLRYFLQKLTLKSGKRIVSKNPFNSLRIETLGKMFPGSVFIRIVRNPLDVVPSSIHMWNIVRQQNCLSEKGRCPGVEEVSAMMAKIESELSRRLSELPPSRSVTTRYEDLVNSPVEELWRIYVALGLTFHKDLETHVTGFLSEVAGFEKNRFRLDSDQENCIRHNLKNYMQQFNYT